jgi:LL-diaminopimelate aminotransferase
VIKVNENYLKIQPSYLFSEIAKRVSAFQRENPGVEICRLGIGDVTLPLPRACIDALHRAADEMGDQSTFRGYGPEQGYAFLREKIAGEDFQSRGADISPEEIFVSDGAKCDVGNIQELFSSDTKVAIPDPVYPVYLDTNVMAGRAGPFHKGRYSGIVYLDCTRENEYLPDLPKEPAGLIYLCFPNNPTGATLGRDRLNEWVEYAREHKALILYDAAYEAFIRDPRLPRSIYEIESAREVAIEFRSFSKTAGFTGVRCAYTVVPSNCRVFTERNEKHLLHPLWNRRQTTKFNGVSYPVQRAAEAVYSPEGRKQVRELIDYYMRNAELIRKEMIALGFECTGGENGPYIWVDVREDSWAMFDMLLRKAGVVCTPGAGFGRCGEGHIRISAFNSHENVQKGLQRIKEALRATPE